jgi:hypothetical protein
MCFFIHHVNLTAAENMGIWGARQDAFSSTPINRSLVEIAVDSIPPITRAA